MFIFPTPLTFCCYFAMLACVAKLVAVKTSQWVWDKQVNFNCQVSNSDLLWHVRSIEGKKQGVGRNNLPLFLHCYTVDLYNTQCVTLISDLNYRQIGELTTSDHTSRRIQTLMHTDMNRTVSKCYCFQQILCLGFSGAPHEEGSISQPLGALKGSSCCLEALRHHEGRQLAQRLFLACIRQSNKSGPTIIR